MAVVVTNNIIAKIKQIKRKKRSLNFTFNFFTPFGDTISMPNIEYSYIEQGLTSNVE